MAEGEGAGWGKTARFGPVPVLMPPPPPPPPPPPLPSPGPGHACLEMEDVGREGLRYGMPPLLLLMTPLPLVVCMSARLPSGQPPSPTRSTLEARDGATAAEWRGRGSEGGRAVSSRQPS